MITYNEIKSTKGKPFEEWIRYIFVTPNLSYIESFYICKN